MPKARKVSATRSKSARGYSGTPLPKKLGIKPGSKVRLVRAPENFTVTLGDLPEGASLVTKTGAGSTLAVWFLRSRAELAKDISRIAAQAAQGPVWLAWPKLTSELAGDLSESRVRDAALAAGLVDYKVAALDVNWSGLLFALRSRER